VGHSKGAVQARSVPGDVRSSAGQTFPTAPQSRSEGPAWSWARFLAQLPKFLELLNKNFSAMVRCPPMAHLSSLGLAVLATLAASAATLGACGTAPSHPSSLISLGGQSSHGGRSGQSGGNAGLGEAGQTPSGGGDSGEGGEGGDVPVGIPTRPLAVFNKTLDVGASCGSTQPGTSLLIQNGGSQPLTIKTASADSGYVVNAKLPLSIAPGAGGTLLVTPPTPKPTAQIGDASTGTLSFTSNEPGTSTHTVALATTLFGARMEFTDHAGMPLGSTLTLTYLEESTCPDTLKYRVHNTGNVAFTLRGPTFPAHLSGTTTGADGLSVAADNFVELTVGGSSAPGDACEASGVLSFSTTGSFCGSVPTLNVVWPLSTAADAGPPCACSAP